MHTVHTSNRHLMSGGRYPVLRTIAILYLIGAAVTALAGIAGFVWALARGPALYGLGQAPAAWSGRISAGLGILAGAFFACLAMLVVAEVIKLFIDMEHNTRSAAASLAMRAEQVQVSTTAPMRADSVVAPETTVATSTTTTTPNRIAVFFHSPDEETAEAALLRGH